MRFFRQALRIANDQTEQAEAARQEAQLQQYVADMTVAQTELSQENMGKARKWLDRHRPISGGKGLRGWEWRWLWQESRGDALFQLAEHEGRIDTLSVSHDGKWLAFMSRRDDFQIWDVSVRKQLRFSIPEFQILDIQFSPTQSEFAILCADLGSSEGSVIQIWNSSTMTFDRSWTFPEPHHPRYIKFSGDGQYLVGASKIEDVPISVWEVATGNLRSSHSIAVDSFGRDGGWAITSNASWIAVGDGGAVVVHDLISGKELWRQKATYDVLITALTFSADNVILASGHGFADGTIRTWDTETGELQGEFQGHLRTVLDLKFGSEGKTLISASGDQTIRVWDLESGAQKRIFRGQGSQVRRIARLSNTRLIAGAGKGTGVYIWNFNNGGKDKREVNRPDQVIGYRFRDRGEKVETVSKRGEVREWNTRTLEPTGWSCNLRRAVEFAVFSSHGDHLTTQFQQGLVVWGLQSIKDPLPIPLSDGILKPIGFVDQDRSLLFIQFFDSDRQRIVEWDLMTNKEKRSWRASAGYTSRDWRSLVTASYLLIDGGTKIFGPHAGGFQFIDRVTGVANPLPTIARMIDRPSNAYDDSSLWPNRQHIALAGGAGFGLLFSSETGFPSESIRSVRFEGFSQGVHGVAFSPDSQQLAIGSVGLEAIKLCRVDAQEEVLTLPGEGSIFHMLSFSDDGNCLAATNLDGLFHLWRAPSWEEIEEAESKVENEIEFSD